MLLVKGMKSVAKGQPGCPRKSYSVLWLRKNGRAVGATLDIVLKLAILGRPSKSAQDSLRPMQTRTTLAKQYV